MATLFLNSDEYFFQCNLHALNCLRSILNDGNVKRESTDEYSSPNFSLNDMKIMIGTVDTLLCAKEDFYRASRCRILQTAYSHYFMAQYYKLCNDNNRARISVQRAIIALFYINGPILTTDDGNDSRITEALSQASLSSLAMTDEIIAVELVAESGQLLSAIVKSYLLAAQIEAIDGNQCNTDALLDSAKQILIKQQCSVTNILNFQNLINRCIPKIHCQRDLAIDNGSLSASPLQQSNNGNNSGNASKTWRCDICGRYYKTKATLTTHKVIHTDAAFECDFCPKRFTTRHKLKIHRRRHLGIKPYKCGVCNAQFTDKCNLVRHSKLHTRSQPQ